MLTSSARKRGTPVNVKPFLLSSLVPITEFPYYTYKGSLTSEPYTESVTWIISPTPIPISQFQLKTFRKVGEIDTALNKKRSLFDLGDRKVNFVRVKQ